MTAMLAGEDARPIELSKLRAKRNLIIILHHDFIGEPTGLLDLLVDKSLRLYLFDFLGSRRRSYREL